MYYVGAKGFLYLLKKVEKGITVISARRSYDMTILQQKIAARVNLSIYVYVLVRNRNDAMPHRSSELTLKGDRDSKNYEHRTAFLLNLLLKNFL